MAIDPSQIRQVRLLIPDTDAIYGANESDYLFSDQDIMAFLNMGHGSSKWAAGLAKQSVGGSEALILKIIKNYETSTNGATLMKEWVAAGKELIEEGKLEVPEGSFDYFEIVFPYENGTYPEGSNRPIGAPLHVRPPWGW